MCKVWLITGCSTGLGRELAVQALKSGNNVIVTARHLKDIEDIVANYPDTGLSAQLDVTNPQHIIKVIRKIKKKFGKIDILINNAGARYFGAVEECDEQDVRRLFDINFFGLARVTKAVLPLMRKQRNGHIVNITSIAGLQGFEGMGYYSATKFAVEGYSEALAKEVEHLGIKVTIIAPSGFNTGWENRSTSICKRNIYDYRDTAGLKKKSVVKKAGKQPGNPVLAAKAIAFVINSDNPPLHLLLGSSAVMEMRNKITLLEEELRLWGDISLGVDFK